MSHMAYQYETLHCLSGKVTGDTATAFVRLFQNSIFNTHYFVNLQPHSIVAIYGYLLFHFNQPVLADCLNFVSLIDWSMY